MKGTKKLLAMLLAFMLVFTLVACNTSKPAEEKPAETTAESTAESTDTQAEEPASDLPHSGKTLKVAGLEGGYGVEGWNKVISAFEALTGAKVEAKFAKNIEDEIRPLIQAGDAPDVIYLSVGNGALTSTMLKENAVLELTDVLDLKVPGEEVLVKDKLLEGVTNSFTTNPYGDGKTYLLPLFYSPTGFFYNKANFGEGKLALPTSVDELVELKLDGAYGFTYPTAGYFDTTFFALVHSVGGPELFTKLMSYDSAAWETEARPVFDAVGKLLSVINPNTVAQANGEGFTLNQLSVMKNESLFMPNGTWIVGEMAEAEGVAEGFEWGMMPHPTATTGADVYGYAFMEQVWVPSTAKEADLAKEFVAFLYSDEAVKLFFENGGALQPVKGAEALVTDPVQKSFYEAFNGVKVVSGSFQAAPAVEGVNLSEVLFDSVNSVANGDKTVDQWHSEVVEAVKKIEEAVKAQ